MTQLTLLIIIFALVWSGLAVVDRTLINQMVEPERALEVDRYFTLYHEQDTWPNDLRILKSTCSHMYNKLYHDQMMDTDEVDCHPSIRNTVSFVYNIAEPKSRKINPNTIPLNCTCNKPGEKTGTPFYLLKAKSKEMSTSSRFANIPFDGTEYIYVLSNKALDGYFRLTAENFQTNSL